METAGRVVGAGEPSGGWKEGLGCGGEQGMNANPWIFQGQLG